jgi:hypothetical protein
MLITFKDSKNKHMFQKIVLFFIMFNKIWNRWTYNTSFILNISSPVFDPLKYWNFLL